MIPTIQDIRDVSGRRVLVRVDWNVPLENGEVRDDFRIQESIPTLNALREAGAKVIIITHLENAEEKSLKPVWNSAKKHIPLIFCPEVVGPLATAAVNDLRSGEVLLLENLRMNPGEKTNDPAFAAELATFGDVYVNEAFSVSHREHASVVGVPKLLPSYVGIKFLDEVENLSKAFNPPHKFLFILGGAKFDTKLPLLEKFTKIADYVFVGGALAHNFFREEGFNIGRSLVSPGDFNTKALLDSGHVLLPQDVIAENGQGEVRVDRPDNLGNTDFIADAGPETVQFLKELIGESKFILWNGPLGNYEKGYKDYTLELARTLAESGKHIIIGGADTLAAIKEIHAYDSFSFVSTAGGAMLDFLAKETLPGIEAIRK